MEKLQYPILHPLNLCSASQPVVPVFCAGMNT